MASLASRCPKAVASVGTREKARLIGAALLAAGPMRPPRPPAAELKPRGG